MSLRALRLYHQLIYLLCFQKECNWSVIAFLLQLYNPLAVENLLKQIYELELVSLINWIEHYQCTIILSLCIFIHLTIVQKGPFFVHEKSFCGFTHFVISLQPSRFSYRLNLCKYSVSYYRVILFINQSLEVLHRGLKFSVHPYIPLHNINIIFNNIKLAFFLPICISVETLIESTLIWKI